MIPASVEALPYDMRIRLADAVQEAADDIVDFGWRADDGTGFPQDPQGDYPRCVWIAVTRALERNDIALAFEAEDAVLAAAEVKSIGELFDLNDNQVPEEGQSWAFGVLISASHILDPALATGDRKTDSSWIGKTDIGSTPNVGSRLLSFLKKFIWVR